MLFKPAISGPHKYPKPQKYRETNKISERTWKYQKAPCNRDILSRNLLKINCLWYIDNLMKVNIDSQQFRVLIELRVRYPTYPRVKSIFILLSAVKSVYI